MKASAEFAFLTASFIVSQTAERFTTNTVLAAARNARGASASEGDMRRASAVANSTRLKAFSLSDFASSVAASDDNLAHYNMIELASARQFDHPLDIFPGDRAFGQTNIDQSAAPFAQLRVRYPRQRSCARRSSLSTKWAASSRLIVSRSSDVSHRSSKSRSDFSRFSSKLSGQSCLDNRHRRDHASPR